MDWSIYVTHVLVLGEACQLNSMHPQDKYNMEANREIIQVFCSNTFLLLDLFFQYVNSADDELNW